MKLLSLVLIFVSAVSLALPLDSEEEQPVLTNETGDFNEASDSPVEVFEDTSLEFLDDQPESRENLVQSEDFVPYEEHVIHKRSTDVATNLWSTVVKYAYLLVSSLWVIADQAVIKPWLNLSAVLSRIFNALSANLSVGGNKPGEPMVRYNLNGELNMQNLLSWDYWTTIIEKLVQDS